MGEQQPNDGHEHQAAQQEYVPLPSLEELRQPYLHAVENLRPIGDIDLAPFLRRKRIDYISRRPTETGQNLTSAIRFVAEKAEGPLEQAAFDTMLDRTIHTSYEIDDLFDSIDVLEQNHPRVTELLERIRDECHLDSDYFVALTKTVWVFTAVRHVSGTTE